MVSLMLVAVFVFCGLLGTASVNATPLEQPPDAATLITRSGQALGEAQSFRMDGALEVASAARGSSISMTFPINGAFMAPDRMHVGVDVGALGFEGEAIVIGQNVWVRAGGEAWESISGVTGDYGWPPMGSSFMSPPPGDIGQFLRDASVVEDGASYRISGMIDLVAALAAVTPPDEMAARMGSRTPFATEMPDLSGSSVTFVYFIDRATMYPTSAEMTMVMPGMPSFSGGAAPGASSDVTITARVTYRDFNDPAIRIEPPI